MSQDTEIIAHHALQGVDFYSRAAASLQLVWVGIVVVVLLGKKTFVSLVIVALSVMRFGILGGNKTFFGNCKNNLARVNIIWPTYVAG